MTLIASRYRSIRPLGQGSMGAVHLAEDAEGNRVAVKLLTTTDEELAARLVREATATKAIAHPNVARAIDVGRDPDGTSWLVMEYVEGRPLRDVLMSGGALHPLRALRIARHVLDALTAAHASGVIHRDIKPENVMLVAGDDFDQESVKVLDFGIAKLDAEKHTLTGPSTNAGVVYGTPTYMAPEQIRREPPDARTDLYALGVMLFEMIAGAPPFDGDDVTVLARHLTLPPPPLSSPLAPEKLTLAVRSFVAKLLAKKAELRPSSAGAARAELDEALATIGTVDATALRTGSTLIPPGALPAPPAAPRGTLKHQTAKLAAFARSYGLTPSQLVFAFAVAFGLILLVLVVAIGASG